MHKALNYMSLARRGGRIELGEEPCGGAARAGHARLIIVAADASPHTWRRAKSYAAGTDQQCLRVPFSKDEMGEAIGRSSLAMAAFTDPALALAFVKALEQREEYREVLENLENKTKRLKQRQDEAKAHQRNVRMGKVRRAPGPKKD
ncbi:MAG: ribosomal L7Ae/L30e/S12e/Gadd45 family protein [Oscillospiraceae bacterium]|nr:ribosomal L7Ae/L30e/S12e/Gadd45 family protein [Oscillospiraceae bacterium]